MSLSLTQSLTLACLWEATAPKPGNVHRGADFDDLTFGDFVTSSVVAAPILAEAATRGIGPTVLAAVEATQTAVGTNTNLGMLLLLAPLAAVPAEVPIERGIGEVLDSLTPDDAAAVYAAINRAQPGGLGEVPEMDVAGPPPESLIDAMQAAAGRDFVARQYTNQFADVLEHVARPLSERVQAGMRLSLAIVDTHVRLIARFGDSLIARKCGDAVSQQAATIARIVLDSGPPGSEDYEEALADFDFWLRSDGHRRNPGTTADLIAAGLFVAFREAWLPAPWR